MPNAQSHPPSTGADRQPSMAGMTADFESEALPHLNDVFRVAMRMLRDHARASDAVQEVYLLAWKNFHRYERGTNCRAWLFQILFNVVRHERRNWFKWITGMEDDLSNAVLIAPEPVPTVLQDKAILVALDRLPPQFRSVLLLVDVEEFSYKEASAILQTPIGTVMSRLSRGRMMLRGQLAEVAKSYGLRAASQG